MASCDNEQGYESDRFENPVSQNFHCPICFNVLKEPVMCRRNQHLFCTGCIIKHLENSQTCPSCMEEITAETLSQAPRVLISFLSELRIRCDYFCRGCPEFVQLADLKTHVTNCGFAPVVCSNQGCSAEVNKRDRVHHEAEVCELRKVKCHDCVEMRKEVDVVKANLTQIREELPVQIIQSVQDEIKKVVSIIAEIKDEMNKEVVQQTYSHQIRNDFIIAGGRTSSNVLNSVEMFSWSKRTWLPLKPMKISREGLTSFEYKSQVVVTGGHSPEGCTDTMETMNINQEPGEWVDFPVRLPSKSSVHKTVVYKDRLFVIGGYTTGGSSDGIYEVQLVPPYSTKLLSRMPQSRLFHGVELHNDTIVIIGGITAKTTSSVAKYDINKNEYKEMARLPFAVNEMATVRWRNFVIVMGGTNKKGEVLNTVVFYDVEKEESHTLPPMKHKRLGCTAVVTGNSIVVMGGENEKGVYLNSVECFSFDRYSWEELPPMTEARRLASAVIKPGNFA